jgi:hypothetical protein
MDRFHRCYHTPDDWGRNGLRSPRVPRPLRRPGWRALMGLPVIVARQRVGYLKGIKDLVKPPFKDVVGTH